MSFCGEETLSTTTLSAGARGEGQFRLMTWNIIVCAIEHIGRKFLFYVGYASIQVCIRFGFNDRVTLAGFRFQATAIKKSDDSSAVANKFGRL